MQSSLGIATVSGNAVANQVSDQLLAQELESTEQTSTPDSLKSGGRGMSLSATTTTTEVETLDELDVSVTAEDLGILAMIGVLIAIISALLPSLTVLRLQPKTILSKQD